MRAMRRALFLFLALAPASSDPASSDPDGEQLSAASTRVNATLELVVAACNEPAERMDELRAMVRDLNATRRAWTATMLVYCKCATHAYCDAYLENVGKEAHTYLEHITRRYDSLAGVTVFVNPGSGRLSRTFNERYKAQLFARLIQQTKAAIADGVMTDAFFADGKQTNPAAAAVSFAAVRGADDDVEAAAMCRENANQSCPLRMTLPCRRHCGCGDPGECRWSGSTAANAIAQRATELRPGPRIGVLPPARPPAFVQWTYQHTAVPPGVWLQCGGACCGLFAVGAARVRARRLGFYSLLSRELVAAGASGGVAGHYMERLWRSMFVCSLVASNVSAPAAPAGARSGPVR